ncbi:MAG: protein-L-isoaspartate O-methyltransferase, partial [Paracoccaceae bacterium]
MSQGGLPEEDDPAERKMRFLFALRSRGVTDARVLNVMERIDRG